MPTGNRKNEPSYLSMTSEERAMRIDALQQNLSSCTLCPRACAAQRLQGEIGSCGAGADLLVSSAGPHFGEERELVGRGGSGTIFFMNCNLECVFCQNWTISRAAESGDVLSAAGLATLMLGLQERGCSNINLVSPTPYISQIAAAIDIAAGRGLRLPVVYNCGGYESVQSLRLLEGFIDIYMPDAKYGSDAAGIIYSGVPDYYTRLQEALKEMQQQVGDLQTGAEGLAWRGLLVRHLVMPGDIASSAEIARFLSEEISPGCAVNVMAQYHPAYRASEFPLITRRITAAEYSAARSEFARRNLRLL